MDLFTLIILLVIFVVILLFAKWVTTLRTIVPMNSADVVINGTGSNIYSGDPKVSPTGTPNAVYYAIPQWIPRYGVTAKRMPLSIIDIAIEDFVTFAKGNPRFVVDVSVYCKIVDVAEAARRFPDTLQHFKEAIADIVTTAVRVTTASFAIEDVISKREEIRERVEEELKKDFEKWGIEITNVAISDIRDPKDRGSDGKQISTVIHDISAKMEASINSNSRMEVANRQRDAQMVEAEAYEASQKRKIEADEQVAMREQQMKMRIAEQEQLAVQKEMDVYRTEQVQKAEIDANAAVKIAEGQKKATVETATGNREKMILEGEGRAKQTETVGMAEAKVIQSKKEADAAGELALAKAQEYQQDKAKEIFQLEVSRDVGLALADALKAAKIEYIGTGEMKSFMDMFTVNGGLNVGGMLTAISKSNPEAMTSIMDVLSNLTKKGETKQITNNYSGQNDSVTPV